MKTLLVIRHAKSSWEDFGMDDFDRPLNDRGKRDAPEMARRLKKRGIKPDLLVSSPARRTHKTAKLFAGELELDKNGIQLEKQLYLAPVQSIYEVLASLDNRYDTVLLFAHNPGLTDFANTLTTVRIDNLPTCGIFAVAADVADWKELRPAEKRFLFFDYPKNPLA